MLVKFQVVSPILDLTSGHSFPGPEASYCVIIMKKKKHFCMNGKFLWIDSYLLCTISSYTINALPPNSYHLQTLFVPPTYIKPEIMYCFINIKKDIPMNGNFHEFRVHTPQLFTLQRYQWELWWLYLDCRELAIAVSQSVSILLLLSLASPTIR